MYMLSAAFSADKKLQYLDYFSSASQNNIIEQGVHDYKYEMVDNCQFTSPSICEKFLSK